MYTQQDHDRVNAQIKKTVLILAAGIAALLALYVFATVKRMKLVMFLILLAMLLYGLPIVAMKLVPLLRYRRFLTDVRKGLTRQTLCTIEGVDAKEEMQDGARVYPVYVALREEEDTRIFYINVSKADLLPQAGETVRIERCGRHIVNALKAQEEEPSL